MYNTNGRRKYLTESETMDFVRFAKQKSKDVYAFCWLMAETGCRISEALAVTTESIDFQAGTLIIKCLKKRGKSVYREVPLSEEFLSFMKKWQKGKSSSASALWTWSRMTAYRRVCEVMTEAGLTGDYATPRGLRHGFGVRAIQSGVPLNLVQRWLGHADMKTTAIYASASGPEERQIAARMWLEGRNGTVAAPAGGNAACKNKTESVERLESRDSAGNVSIGAGSRTVRTRAGVRLPWTLRSAARLIYCHLLRYWLFRLKPRRNDFGGTNGGHGSKVHDGRGGGRASGHFRGQRLPLRPDPHRAQNRQYPVDRESLRRSRRAGVAAAS
ncbi:MAG: site-specific integrase [Pseudorhodoplanes sp.]|nr:site-specific integrase [Pseudorhodoplanes sp.]